MTLLTRVSILEKVCQDGDGLEVSCVQAMLSKVFHSLLPADQNVKFSSLAPCMPACPWVPP